MMLLGLGDKFMGKKVIAIGKLIKLEDGREVTKTYVEKNLSQIKRANG